MDIFEAAAVGSPTAVCGNGCEGKDTEATHYCEECRAAICGFCVAAHRRQRRLANHCLTDLAVRVVACEPRIRGADAPSSPSKTKKGARMFVC